MCTDATSAHIQYSCQYDKALSGLWGKHVTSCVIRMPVVASLFVAGKLLDECTWLARNFTDAACVMSG